MDFSTYTGQKTGIYHFPKITRMCSDDIWTTLIGVNYEEKRFQIEFKNGSNHSLLDIIWWCEERCEGVVFIKLESSIYIGFHKRSDAVKFKLTWAGK